MTIAVRGDWPFSLHLSTENKRRLSMDAVFAGANVNDRLSIERTHSAGCGHRNDNSPKNTQ
jgi:hypothetical protein